jgi:hypothetical protein
MTGKTITDLKSGIFHTCAIANAFCWEIKGNLTKNLKLKKIKLKIKN